MKFLIAFILFSISFSKAALADLPYEVIYVDKKNVPFGILIKTIGIITLNSGIKGGITLNLYDDNFQNVNCVNLRDNSSPISSFGYHPSVDTLISNFRYPFIDKNNEYIKIVIDFKNSISYWFNLEEINQKFNSKIIYINNIHTDPGEFLSLFGLTNQNNRKLYTEPSESSRFAIITSEEIQNKLLKIVDQKGDYVKIAIVEPNYQMDEETITNELGWIKIRDDNGAVSIWVIMVDLFS